jgi:ABC transport system ATP-binding/permease protein
MPPPLIQLKNASLRVGAQQLFKGLDIALARGERVALVGANGAGKSTLMRVLAGLVEPDAGERSTASGVRAAISLQEPDLTGRETLADYAGEDVWADDAQTRRALGAAMLDQFGLDPERSPAGLSGGEERRAALARLFASEPDLMMLDEPTNHLDIEAIELLEKKLAGYPGAVLVVSHDRRFLERIATAAIWLRDGVALRMDGPFAGFEAWAEAIEAAEEKDNRRLDKTLETEARWLARGVTARRTRNMGRLRRLMAMREVKRQRLMAQRKPADITAASSGTSGALVLEAKGLSKAWPGGVAVEGLSLRIMRGDRLGLVGPNGAGKSTLIRLLTGDLQPDAGTVRIGAGVELALVDQARDALDPARTVWETLAPDGGDQVSVRGRPRHVAAYARDFLFRADQLRQPAGALSGGERRRLALAVALARPSNLLVLDEPTNDLDVETLDLLEQALIEYDGTVIVVSHDRAFLDGVVDATLAPAGDGRWIETPGGWADLEAQGIPWRKAAPVAAAKPAPRAETQPKIQKKLSFKDEHRLKELEGELPRLTAEIARLEGVLSDAGLYARDPAGWTRTNAALDRARAALDAAEEDWLRIETLKEALGA